MHTPSHLGQEWQTLQNNHEQHERNALLIKLVCLALCGFGLVGHVVIGWLAVATLLLWAQEAIIKTYQSRLGERLLHIEALLRQTHTDPAQPAMQLHSQWATQRPARAKMIAGYAISACRPTVAFPYLPMLLVGWVHSLF